MAGPITQILDEVQRGTPGAREELFRLCYAELRRLAAAQMRQQRGSHTLQPTALVNEACLRMLGGPTEVFRSRGTFFSVAAKAMRSILVDLARAKSALKRGGLRERVPLTGAEPHGRDPTDEILAVHEALDRLAEQDPFLARVVELRFFGGLTAAEAAQVLDVSERTVYGAWETARLLLHERLS
jgi:RNA polymerase sigma factor (TIGR02999 family)